MNGRRQRENHGIAGKNGCGPPCSAVSRPQPWQSGPHGDLGMAWTGAAPPPFVGQAEPEERVQASDLPNAASATPSTHASVPPATMTSASPARIRRKASPIASAPAPAAACTHAMLGMLGMGVASSGQVGILAT